MAEAFLYLTTTGRVSGQPRKIEIWFVEHAGRHYVVAEHRERAQWVKNLQANPQIEYCIGTREAPGSILPPRPAQARLLNPQSEPDLIAAVCEKMNQKYRWSDGLVVELAA